MNCILFTASELRHDFMRKALALHPGVNLLRTFCEVKEHKLKAHVAQDPGGELQQRHLQARALSEQDFFSPFVRLAPDASNPKILEYGQINEPACYEEVMDLAPDLLCAYGCSLVKDPLLSAMKGRFLNVHLGLSPYYRGTGTNFWPLVNGEPEFVGATFMHIDAGVDTGHIIHQIRARIFPGDSPHQIGNRLIADVALVYGELIARFEELEPMPQPSVSQAPHAQEEQRYYTRKDFTPDAVERLYANFASGLVARYLDERESCDARAPLVVNPPLALFDPAAF